MVRTSEAIRDQAPEGVQGRLLATMYPAGDAAVERVLHAPVDEDGRSEWRWFLLVNGDLIFGCFPCGDTYEMITDDALPVPPTAVSETGTCRHCERRIVTADGRWVDPQATGDDSVWRETCDSNDTFAAPHEPA